MATVGGVVVVVVVARVVDGTAVVVVTPVVDDARVALGEGRVDPELVLFDLLVGDSGGGLGLRLPPPAATDASVIYRSDSGFTGFNTPSTFRQFNRAIAARAAAYYATSGGGATAWQTALTALSASSGTVTNCAGSGPAKSPGVADT